MYRASNNEPRTFGRQALRAAILSLLLCSLLAAAASAHEPIVLPIKLGDKPRILNLVTRHGHLSFSGAPIDFGDVVVGTTVSASLTATNTTTRALTVALSAPAGVAVVPSTFSLAAGATSPPLNVTWAPTQSGPLNGTLTLAISHDDVTKAHDETLAIVGNAGAAAALRFDVPTFAEVGVGGTNFGMVSVEDVAERAPTFEMKVTNVGGLPARGVRVVVQGPGAILAIYGVCHEGLNEAGICVGKKIGTDGNGEPIFEARADFGDLAPNASVTALWHIVPANAGLIDKPFDIRFTTGTETTERNQTFDIAGEVIAYEIPGEGFLKAGTGGGGKEGFGAAVDPLDGDELGALRPTGFDARTVFSVDDIDTVDLRTGSATLVIPIGGPQAVRGPLSYELQAVFNSHLWHRRTLTELTRETPNGEPKAKPLSGEYPNPIFNLGTGWSFHLGRLLPPYVLDGIPIQPQCPTDPLAFEKQVHTGPRFVFVNASGTQHEFWRELHGNDITPISTGTYQDKEILYTRDGSYLRLVLDLTNSNRRWVEEPSGIKRLYVRQGSVRQPTLPDEWLLHSIEDQYGNRVTIQYGPTTWTIRDDAGTGGTAWRTTTVNFTGWTGKTSADPMVVSSVEFPAFSGQAPRIYDFFYTDESLGYPSRSLFHTALVSHCGITTPTVKMPRLDRITLADGSAYTFAYEHPADDRIRLQSATLPTGATIGYQYASVWDSPPDCNNTTVGTSINGVSRRTVTDVGGGVISDQRYLRETQRTADVPNTICRAFNPNDESSNKAPFSEQTVAVWSVQETGLSTASVHHFNIYPFDDRCNWPGDPPEDTTKCEAIGNGVHWRLKSGRTHIERNLKVSHLLENRDPLDAALRRSEELYECTAGLNGLNIPRTTIATGDQVGDDVSVLTQACTKRQTTYAQYEVTRAGHQCQQASAHCLRDSRLKASRTEYHDDNNRWVKRVKDHFDGLGHYRQTTTRSTFDVISQNGTLDQTTFQNWNPNAGTLTLNDDHTIANNVTLPSRWLLGTWDYQWTTEGSDKRGREACFDPLFGHLTHDRVWESTAINTSNITTNNIAANRRNQDLVTSHEINPATGELDRQRFFGADTFPEMTTANGWCSSANWTENNQDYAVDYGYDYGVLRERRVAGNSIYDLRRTIDQATGWPLTETGNNGDVVTFDYDPMGRVTWATSQLTASHHADYRNVGGRWQLTTKVFPKGTTASTVSPSPIRIYDAAYDGLGRLRSETLPLYNDNPASSTGRQTVTRTVTYHPSGSIRAVSSLDTPSGPPTTINYDYRARPLQVTHPDGSKSARQYSGVRKTVLVSCVDTGIGSTTGICKNTGFQTADTVLQRDWKGRTVKVTAPLGDGTIVGGFETTFQYDPLDKQTQARRTHREGVSTVPQTRSWTHDGRGFLTHENIPERAAMTFSNFTTRGAPQTLSESGRTKSLTFDPVGRLRRVAVGSRALKRFVYCDPLAEGTHSSLCSTTGPTNGQLIAATRNNYRQPADSGLGVLATWVVDSTFGYDNAGRLDQRATSVFWGTGWSSNPTPGSQTTTFDQSWTYDDLGNVTALGYPTCDTASPDCNISRTVGYTYRQGFFLTSVDAGTLGAGITYHKSGIINQVQHLGGGGNDNYGVAGGMPRIDSALQELVWANDSG